MVPTPPERDVQDAPGNAHGDQHAGRGDLTGELRQRVQTPTVVDQSDAHDHRARHQDRRQTRRIDEPPGERRKLGCQKDGGDNAQKHRQPAHPRGWRHVHIAFARVGDRSQSGGQHPHRPSREVGDDCRGQSDQRELAKRDTGAAIGQGEQTTGKAGYIAGHLETVLHQPESRITALPWPPSRSAKSVTGLRSQCASHYAVKLAGSNPRTSATRSTLTGPARRTRGSTPVRSTIVDAACCSDGPASR